MPVLIKKGTAYKTGTNFYTKVNGTWRQASRVYTKVAGAWVEAWPLTPNIPQTATHTQAYANDDIEITANWTAPVAGGAALTKYQVRLWFTNISTGAAIATAWVDKTTAQFSHVFNNSGSGWQHLSGTYRVQAQVVSFSSTAQSGAATSAATTVMTLPAPPAPTSFDVNIVECDLTETWAHVGGNRLDKFEIETWLGTNTPTKYTVSRTLRSWGTYPWNAATIGRQYTYSRIRAVGDGGASAWVTVSGVMPGPVTMSNFGFQSGVLKVTLAGNYEGVDVYRSKYGGSTVLQGYTTGQTVTVSDTASSGYARDNASQYRLLFRPRNSANGWTGRLQSTAWAIKIPLPVYVIPSDCNTWWSIPIPGKWRTNPQAEDWFYQGKSISGNSQGTLFYEDSIIDFFSTARIGYTIACTALDVYLKRASVGGLASPVTLSIWTHPRVNDVYDAPPGKINGPQLGPSLNRSQQAWVRVPSSWFPNLASGAARGFVVYVDPNDPNNQLRPEIGNVSNFYMILDKPQFGAHLDGKPPGTMRIYHDA